MKANIRPRGCRAECRTTWRYDYGPDQSLEGTFAYRDDVRRCEHGRIWRATGRIVTSRYYTEHDVWEPISFLWSPIQYRRARLALEEAGSE